MARIRNNHLGTLSGKVGDLIFKRTKSGSFVYMNRRVRRKSHSEKSVLNNNRFILANRFASLLNSSPMLKTAWHSFRNLKGPRAYDKIHSFNSPHCRPDFISEFANILADGISLDITGFSHDDDNIVFNVKSYNDFHELYADPFSAVAVIYLNMPFAKRIGRKSLPHNAFIMVEQDFGSLNMKDDLTSVIRFENYTAEFRDIEYYQRVRVYLSVFFRNKEDVLKWTNSGSYLYKGHEIEKDYNDAEAARIRSERAELRNPKPQPKYRRIIKK